MHLLPYALHWMQVIQSAGWTGYLMFIALYAACCVFFIPASFLTLAAGAVYGFWGGMALVLAGNALGSLLCLLFTRYFFHGWAMRKYAKNKKLKAVADAVKHDGWKIVFLTRLSPFMPYSLINYALGITNISARKFLLATVLGSVPATAVYIYAGTLMGNLARVKTDMHKHGTVHWIFQGIGLVMTVVVTVYMTHLATKSLKKRMRES